jgi:hypothetical protein
MILNAGGLTLPILIIGAQLENTIAMKMYFSS